MPKVTLPDGSIKDFTNAITVLDVANSISKNLALATICGVVNGKPVDTCYLIECDSKVVLMTDRDFLGLEVVRHSFAHLVGHAVKQLFPAAKMVIGPVIEDGFYYDIDYERPFTPEDLSAIEARIQQLIKTDYQIDKRMTSIDEARDLFMRRNETYKVALIDELIEKGEVQVGLYYHQEYIDMCRGPHVPNTRFLRVFKLMKVSGAYWKGDSNNRQLQRIYGTAWRSKKELTSYLHRLEEAEKRDHRKLAKQLDLFHLQEQAPGMVFWHPDGWWIYQRLERYMRAVQTKAGYQEIRTPQVVDIELWKKSGHCDHYQEYMFVTESEKRTYAVKPMSCPGHVQVFNQGLKSYRDLPIRFSEFGCCHRNEPSGALHGIMRVRGFTQDDAHIFVTPEQVMSEATNIIQLTLDVYKEFGFSDVEIKLSTRPENRMGDDALWDKAEQSLQNALSYAKLDWQLQEGEGAFYGPKIEFSLKDCLNRVWQCGTLQLDFMLPNRLGAQYIDEQGQRQAPIMLHRAILGSFERFIGILLEHHAGAMPTWLSPQQVVILNITDAQKSYCQEIEKNLIKKGFNVKIDIRNEKIGFKIRQHTLKKVPYLLIVGDKEVNSRTVSVRTRHGKELGVMSEEEFIKCLQEDIEHR